MEKLYQYLWKHRMLGKRLHLSDGTEIDVIDPGRLNNDAGPDFFNAKLRIGTEEWVGNVEIHVRASDWMRHGHDSDRTYDSVVLHVVGASDCVVRRGDGSVIPQVELALPKDLYSMWSVLDLDINAVKCEPKLGQLDSLTVTDWMETLTMERLQKKAKAVMTWLEANGSDWQQTAFTALARAMGFGLNGEPFELLARSVPLKVIGRHSNNRLQIEALLFGQAGMLDSSLHIFDEYYHLLCREYYFLARKYGLRPLNSGIWKYARTRPQNFPHRRIALLAGACVGGFGEMRKWLDCDGDVEGLMAQFDWTLEGYWETHYSFGSEESPTPSKLTKATRQLLLINAVAPIYYAYGASIGNPELAEKGYDILRYLPAERNSITKRWQQAGLPMRDAAMSQALIHLRREYCERRECLKCRFGNKLLRGVMYKSELLPAYS